MAALDRVGLVESVQGSYGNDANRLSGLGIDPAILHSIVRRAGGSAARWNGRSCLCVKMAWRYADKRGE
jgi:hypothetical protein